MEIHLGAFQQGRTFIVSFAGQGSAYKSWGCVCVSNGHIQDNPGGCFSNFLSPAMFLNDSANFSESENEPHSAFSQTEHNIVAAYLITAGMNVDGICGRGMKNQDLRLGIEAFCVIQVQKKAVSFCPAFSKDREVLEQSNVK